MFGVLLVASASLTSCKDYDDDIQNNTEQIQKLSSEVSDLTSALNACKTECQAAIQQTVTDLTSQIAAAKAELQKAVDAKADAEAVSKLAERVAELETKLVARVTALETQVGTINKSIEDLQAAVDQKLDKSDFEAFKKAYDEAVATYTVWKGNVNDKLAALEKADEKIKTEFNDSLSARDLAIKDLKQQLEALNNFFGAIEGSDLQQTLKNLEDRLTKEANEKYATLGERVDSVAKVTKATMDKLDATNGRIDELSKDLNENFVTITKLNEDIATLTTLINRKLTSLVLKPAFYYGGIEAVEVPTMQNYQSYTGKNELTLKEVWSTDNAPKVTISSGGVATYHTNPALANLEGYKLDFYGNDPVTRAGIQYVTSTYDTFDALVAANASNYAAGLIKVPFTVNYEAVKKTTDGGKTPMIAFQMTRTEKDGERTVTSDYAMLNITDLKDLILADNATEGKDDHQQQLADDLQHNHIFGQMEGQVVNDLADEGVQPTHEIAYEESLDLKKIVETHYTYTNTAAGTVNADQKMDEGTFDALGLKYEFALIEYTLSGRSKAESEYVTLEDGVVAPVQDELQSAKGHLPIVRVLLKDSEDNVLKIGYIKLKIAGVTEPVQPQTYEGLVQVTCDGAVFNSVTVAAAEEALYTDPRIDMTKEQFEATYQYVASQPAQGGNPILKQNAIIDDKFVEVDDDATVGTVTTDGTNFIWTLPTSVTDTMKVDAAGKNIYPFATYIRYYNRGELNAFVKLIIPAGAMVKPVVTWDMSNKVLARWYKENGKSQDGTAKDLTEIHVNPEVVGQPNAEDLITYDMLNGFLEKKLSFTMNEPFDPKDNVKDFQFKFITKPGVDEWVVYGRSGNSYTLTVSEDGLKLYAKTKNVAKSSNYPEVTENEEIATLSGEHNSIVTYNTKAQEAFLASYDILNKNGHNELAEGETFKAYIGVQAKVCDWQNAGKFTVRFLRPVDLNTTSAEPAVDAVDGGYYVDLKELFETPTDWRDQWKDNYWEYYGITTIEAEVEKAFTDAAQPKEKRTALKTGFENKAQIESLATVGNANVQFEYVAPDADHKFGRVLYTNNNATIGNFHIYVPITVTYDWGYKVSMGYACVDVNFTINNAKRK